MILTGNHLKAARALAELDQERLSELSDVSINTIRNMEACGADAIGGYESTRQKVQSALEALGIEFMNGGQPGVRLVRQGRRHDSETDRGESRPAAAPTKASSARKAHRRRNAGRGKA
jgi:hypothetical protein